MSFNAFQQWPSFKAVKSSCKHINSSCSIIHLSFNDILHIQHILNTPIMAKNVHKYSKYTGSFLVLYSQHLARIEVRGRPKQLVKLVEKEAENMSRTHQVFPQYDSFLSWLLYVSDGFRMLCSFQVFYGLWVITFHLLFYMWNITWDITFCFCQDIWALESQLKSSMYTNKAIFHAVDDN